MCIYNYRVSCRRSLRTRVIQFRVAYTACSVIVSEELDATFYAFFSLAARKSTFSPRRAPRGRRFARYVHYLRVSSRTPFAARASPENNSNWSRRVYVSSPSHTPCTACTAISRIIELYTHARTIFRRYRVHVLVPHIYRMMVVALCYVWPVGIPHCYFYNISCRGVLVG